MKQIPLMHLRQHLGEVLNEVKITNEPVVLERSGKAIAMICPMNYLDRDTQGPAQRKAALEALVGQGKATARSKDLSDWLKKKRRNG